jgi:prepilin-type processing-associated H-X9-DG protein
MPRRRRRKVRRDEGRRVTFSTFELAVAGGALLLVASVVLPLVLSARGVRQRGTCTANLRHVGLALRAYVADCGGRLPKWSQREGAPGSAPPEGEAETWDTQAAGRMSSPSKLCCPQNPNGAEKRSYALPLCLSGVEEARVPEPELSVLLFEKGAYLPGSWRDAVGENYRESTGTQLSAVRWHGRGKNFLFLDGHVKHFGYGSGPFAQANRTEARPGDCIVAGPAPLGDWPISN